MPIEDAGLSWLPLHGPFEEVWVLSVSIAPSDLATIYLASEIGVFVSRDRGASWTEPGLAARVIRVVDAR
jgi:hypothetical protein